MPRPCNIAAPELTRAFLHVEPSGNEDRIMRPCSFVLTDGRRIDRVMCIEEAKGFHEGDWIHPAEIRAVAESPYRLPAGLARKLYDTGESGIGYYMFVLELTNGDSYVCTTGGIVDFPYLPRGVTSADIADVHPHAGETRSRREGCKQSADFSFCYYVPYM